MSTANVVLVWSEQAEDEPWVRRVREHLEALRFDGGLRVWDPRDIEPGALTATAYRAALEGATVAVVLVSAALLARAELVDGVLVALVERAEAGLTLIPVHIHPTVADQRPLGRQGRRLTEFEGVGQVEASLDGLSWSDAERHLAELARRVRTHVVGAPLAMAPPAIAASAETMREPPAAQQAARLIVEFERRRERLITTYARPGESALAHTERDWPRGIDALLDTLDSAHPTRFAALLREREPRWGAELFEILFGADEAVWQRVLRAVYGIAPEAPAPTPVRGGVDLRLSTREPALAALPWRLTRWRDWRLVDVHWLFTVQRSRAGALPISMSTQAGFCVLAPQAAPAGVAARPQAALEKLRRSIERIWQPVQAGVWRQTGSRAGLIATLKGQRSRVLLVHAHAVALAGEVTLLLDAQGARSDLVELLDDPPERLRLDDLEACWRSAGQRPDLIVLSLHLHDNAAALLREALATRWLDVPLVVAPALAEPDWQTDAFLSAWIAAWLQAGTSPLAALTNMVPEHPLSTTLWSWAHYEDWRTAAPKPRVAPQPLHLRFDRKKPKAAVVGLVQDLAEFPEQRVMVLIGQGSADDAVELLSEQFTQHLRDRAGHAIVVKHLRLNHAFDGSAPSVDALREHLRLALDAHDGETEAQLLWRYVPTSAPEALRRVLWLDWGVLTGEAQIETWSRGSARVLRRACPPELRVVSFAALALPGIDGRQLARRTHALERELRDDTIMVRSVDLDEFSAGDIRQCLLTTECPRELASPLAELVYERSAGQYRTAVAWLESGQPDRWHDLLDELEAHAR